VDREGGGERAEAGEEHGGEAAPQRIRENPQCRYVGLRKPGGAGRRGGARRRSDK